MADRIHDLNAVREIANDPSELFPHVMTPKFLAGTGD